MSKKYTFKYIKEYFKEQRCELLEKEYKDNKTHLEYKCNCGNISKINFKSFKIGQRCSKCKGGEKLTYEYVNTFFKKENCELLEKEYKNARSKLKYKCNCGDVSKIVFDHFRLGQRCKKCGIKKNSGCNHYNYNPNLTDKQREDNKNRRRSPFYKKWREKVYKRDQYTCQKCFQLRGKLNAHHIKNYKKKKKLRFIKFNGITFCNDCHSKFHKKYGYKNNNKKQINEYLKTG
ncbi:MAG: hypothetical protein ACTSSP_00195 [Candidatus Asgardarchaeia archaeon]